MVDQPNILFIFSDQHRHDVLGAAGHPLVKTPHLDRIAHEGARFTSAWCQSPICQPSRASVITGAYTEDLGMFANTGAFDADWPTIMAQLQSVGYETASIGKTHYHGMPSRDEVLAEATPYDLRRFEPFVRSFGWDYVLEEYDKYAHVSSRVRSPYIDYLQNLGLLEDYREQIRGVFRLTPTHWRGEVSRVPQEHDLSSFIGDHAMHWLTRRDSTKPFFLKLAFVQPHVPLIDDPTWADYYRDADIPLPEQRPARAPNDVWGDYLAVLDRHSQVETMDEDFVRNGIRHYLGMISLIDQKVGDVLELLESQGALSNTWVVYTCDHGEMLGEHRLWAKMNFYKGAVQVPLLIRPPAGGDGREVDALVELTDVTATLADIAGAEPPSLCRGHSLLPALDGGGVGREIVRSRIGPFSAVRDERYRFTLDRRTGTPCELFDLDADPGEYENLVDETSHAHNVRRLTQAATAE